MKLQIMKQEMINMINRWSRVPFAIVTMWATIGVGLGQQPAQPTFQSTTEATQALFQAVQSNNEEAIAKILGGSTDLTSSRDEAQDKADRDLFVQKYQEMHRVGREPDGSETLYIGAENWPFPIPLVAKDGAWRFDPDAGAQEVIFRRIGDNELTAIATCHEFIAAERRYRTDPKTADPADTSVASLIAKSASGSLGGDTVKSHGYQFRAFSRTSGFVLIAYPAEYRSSGVMTFIVTANDIVYEKDLGANTSALASAMAAFHKDATWHVAGE
jgi:hypothetical protein